MSKRGLHLYKRLALTTLTALIGLGGAAQADIHAAGPVYGGSTQASGVFSCRVFNFGTMPVTFTTRQILDSTNAPVTLAVDTCGGTTALQPGQSCVYLAQPISATLAYSCRLIDTSTTPSNLSGVADIQNSTGATVLNALPLTH
jgi:hypothetical protein